MTCKDCIHYEVCKNIIPNKSYQYLLQGLSGVEGSCKFFKDKFKYIELPNVYEPRCYIQPNKDSFFKYKVVKEVNFTLTYLALSREEAEAKLKELKENG